MTKRELIEALEAMESPDETPVVCGMTCAAPSLRTAHAALDWEPPHLTDPYNPGAVKVIELYS